MKRIQAVGLRKAFTLIELLVVILIIGVVIAIVVPALGKARRTARVSVTRNLVTQVVTSATSYQTDNRRIPGYYSAKDMGAAENSGGPGVGGTGIGMSNMHNALIDLTGGPTSVGTNRVIAGGAVNKRNERPLAPFAPGGARKDEVAYVNPGTMGSAPTTGQGAKAYFVPPAKHFLLPRLTRGTDVARFGTLDDANNIKSNDGMRMPDLVDAFGTPILWWGEDETVNGPYSVAGTPTKPQFARSEDSTKPAKFYWGGNAAYLKATSLGRNRTDQTKDGKPHSLIGAGINAAELNESLAGLLSNPSFADGLSAATGINQVLPSGPRGKFVVHAADPDGYYLSTASRGAKEVSVGGSPVLKFGYNFFIDASTRRKDDKNQPTSSDVLKNFEDIVAPGGS